jgi:hypothetical protein
MPAELTRSSIVPKTEMGPQNLALAEIAAPASASLTALAEQLRDGPLRELMQLQLKATALADRLADNPVGRLEDVEQLIRLSLSTMEQFHAFTREFAAVLRGLTDAPRDAH